MVLIVNCGGGLPNDLHVIRSGTQVTLQRGDVEGKVVVTHEIGSECAFNYIEIDENTAKTFGLNDGNRVVLNYDSETRELRMQRLVKSQAYGLLLPDPYKNRDNSIVIGYALLSLLGIPDAPDTSVTFRNGSVSKKLRVIIPENELDADFRLSLANLRKFRLLPGKQLRLEYNQSSQTLCILMTAAVAAKPAKLRKPPVKSVRR